ncbi:hypothetical protein [Heyndrickxia ginsengihumi]|uniref:Uncharacterized protein n=1 Tax=Heyndrickxia ginsengihumi TaxID=363870 RepID=A0A6M0P9D0_9BACI|nr:hypothetical protein [Heyndrickxia ginsengihumi]MBE6184633.1 hypothetical protein [Bacillus sp. (in: firmicutes)]MCM3024253.1 hypothetical protein [Heyndrickxia ginsengihumi]NEY20609.1 hypothetical protein [Heyndrickxia ginsengihumi]
MFHDWMDSYISKVTGKSYIETEITEILIEIFSILDQKLKNLQQTSIQFVPNESKIMLPDCSLTFKIHNAALDIYKFDQSNKKLCSIRVLDSLDEYHVKLPDDKILLETKDLKKALDCALFYLLVENKNK